MQIERREGERGRAHARETERERYKSINKYVRHHLLVHAIEIDI